LAENSLCVVLELVDTLSGHKLHTFYTANGFDQYVKLYNVIRKF